MDSFDSQCLRNAGPEVGLLDDPPASSIIVADERAWCQVPHDGSASPAGVRVRVTRWQAGAGRPVEAVTTIREDTHVVKVVLRTANIRLAVFDRLVHDGVVAPGMVHVTEPGAEARCLFRGAYDMLHLHVPVDLVAEYGREVFGGRAIELRARPGMLRDPMAEALGRALMEAERTGGSFKQLYADCVSVAIVARLLDVTRGEVAADRPKVAALPNWRLRRAFDYVEAHIADPVSLADLAESTGLTRMHFAAQFKAATGLRPHEYLLRRRVERAQEMLLRDQATVVDVALSVGFETQSHFTTVFKRFVGLPPNAWRLAQRDRSVCVAVVDCSRSRHHRPSGDGLGAELMAR